MQIGLMRDPSPRSLDSTSAHSSHPQNTPESTPRASTPVPLGNDDFPGAPLHHFLDEPFWKAASFRYHIDCTFISDNNAVKLKAGRIATTYLPFNVDSNTRTVFCYWSSQKSVLRKGMVPLDDIQITPPQKKGQIVMVLQGEHRGEVASVFRYRKKQRQCDLRSLADSGVQWTQAEETVCLLKQHTDEGCQCTAKATDY